MITIITKKFTLRPFQKSNARNIAKYINDKQIYRNTSHIPYPYKLKDAHQWLKKILPNYRKKIPHDVHLAIEINNEICGCVSLMEIDLGHKAEIGYWLARKYWGGGIMSTAVQEMLKFGCKELKLKRVYAYVFTFNKASVKVLMKNGFKKEGLLKRDVVKDRKRLDSILLAKMN